MYYIIICSGKNRTTHLYDKTGEEAKKYLRRKQKAGFTLLKEYDGTQSTLALRINGSRFIIRIQEN